MATLHVRNVPDRVYSKLRTRAAAERRSLSAEVIQVLAKSVDEPTVDVGELLNEIRHSRLQQPCSELDSAQLLHEDRYEDVSR